MVAPQHDVRGSTLRALCAIVAIGFSLYPLAACDTVPRDPESSLARARGGILRVGATDAPPWILRAGDALEGQAEAQPPGGSTAEGAEADLIRGFAGSIGARILWTWGPVGEHMERLQNHELDLVAAGLTEQTPWRDKVGLTTPWLDDGRRKRVLAVAPGENALLSALERYIRERSRTAPGATTAAGTS